jgi:AcrR family transcriptional regulator
VTAEADIDPGLLRRAAQARARAQRRDDLLDASVALIRSDGPFVSMEQIAAACGVTKPILYRHFGDRDGIVMALAERFVARLEGLLAPALTSDAPAEDLLRRTIDAYLRLVESDTNLYRFLSAHAGADRRDLLAALVAEGVSVALAQRLADAGEDPLRARPWAYGLVGMVHFAGDWWADDRTLTREGLVDQLMALAWNGLADLDLDRRAAHRNAASAPNLPQPTPHTKDHRP